jgi:hypothetical protein
MAEMAAGQPFYENTWLAAGNILLFLAILGAMLAGLVVVMARMVRWIRGRPRLLRWIVAGATSLVILAVVIVTLRIVTSPYRGEEGIPPSPQDLLQQHLTQDERALDKGALTYPALPILKPDQLITLTVTVTDLGKHPGGSMTAQAYSQVSGLIVYPGDVPTGGIVGLHLTCTNVHCQALSNTRQAIVGLGTSRSWSWDLTPLQPGPASVVITAATYDGITSTVLDQEIIPVSLKVEKGPWWTALDGWWHAMTNFATTTAGLITTIGGAVAVIAGGAEWVRRTRTGKAQTCPERATPPEADASARGEVPPQSEDKSWRAPE